VRFGIARGVMAAGEGIETVLSPRHCASAWRQPEGGRAHCCVHLLLGLTALGMPSDTWRQAFAIAGAVVDRLRGCV
jgi:hypothetical protein